MDNSILISGKVPFTIKKQLIAVNQCNQNNYILAFGVNYVLLFSPLFYYMKSVFIMKSNNENQRA